MRRPFLKTAACLALGHACGFARPSMAATSEARDVVVVLDSGEARITLIDRTTHRIVGGFPVGKEPHHLLATPDERAIVVASAVGNELIFLDPGSGRRIGSHAGIDDPYQIGFSPDQRWFVVNCLRLNRVDFYRYGGGSEFHIARRLELGELPSHMAFTADGSKVFISLQGSNQVAAIDIATQSVLWILDVGPAPAGVWLTPRDAVLLVALTGSDRVVAIDWRRRRIVKQIVTGEAAHNFRSAGDGRRVLLSNRIACSISLIDLAALEVVGQIRGLRPGPDDMEVSSDRRWLWTTFRFARSVGVIDLSAGQLVDVIEVGRSPHGLFLRDRAPYYDNLPGPQAGA